jgi:hypothetical protein
MARITFEVTQEQHSHIKMMAASKGISIRDYFLQQMEKTIPQEEGKRLARRTRKTLEKADRHQNLHYAASTADFYAELGLSRYIAELTPLSPAPKNVKNLATEKAQRLAA